jgi:hypothetical protein
MENPTAVLSAATAQMQAHTRRMQGVGFSSAAVTPPLP